MINKAILLGRLGRDPEARATNSGNTIVNISLATDHRTKVGDSWESVTEWHKVVAFGRTAENVAKYCSKGSQVYIEGRIQTRKWEKDGETKYATEVVANEVKFVGSKGDAAPQRERRPASRQPVQQDAFDDVPF